MQIAGLLDGQRNWVTNLANASSVLYNSMNRFSAWKDKRVNWAGFYLLSPLFPGPVAPVKQPTLWLGPFCGLPACQAIPSVPGRGVCADGSAVLPPKTVCVPRTEDYRAYNTKTLTQRAISHVTRSHNQKLWCQSLCQSRPCLALSAKQSLVMAPKSLCVLGGAAATATS